MSKDNRKNALTLLLRPIKWCPSSSISQRQNMVTKAHERVHMVMPFLDEEETALAREWLKRNQFSGLWD
jgi:hypothetical protein